MRKHRRLIIVLGLVMLSVFALGATIWPNTTWARAQRRMQAEQRWSRRTFGNYRLDLTDKGCLQQIDVRNERVTGVAPNRCDAQPRSVGGLFELIRRDGTVSIPCIYQGCLCDDVIYVIAAYHQELGYPTRIVVRLRAEPNWRRAEYWQWAFKQHELPDCSQLSEGSKVIEVVDVIPVPAS